MLYDFSGTMQVTRSGVVAQSRPMVQHIVYWRLRQLGDRGETLHKALIVANHRCDLSLLQHDLANPDSVWADLLLPRQIVSAVLPMPGDELSSEPVQCVRQLPKSCRQFNRFCRTILTA